MLFPPQVTEVLADARGSVSLAEVPGQRWTRSSNLVSLNPGLSTTMAYSHSLCLMNVQERTQEGSPPGLRDNGDEQDDKQHLAASSYDPSTWEVQEDCQFEASLGYNWSPRPI